MDVEGHVPASAAAPHTERAQLGEMAWAASSPSGRLVQAILLAQVLSVALAVTGVSSQALTSQGVFMPTMQSCLNYCLLAVVFGGTHWLVPRLRFPRRRLSGGAGVKQLDAAAADGERADCSSSSSGSGGGWQRPRGGWLAYAALALLDVEANTLVTKAYQYTSLTSVTLLDCATIPCVMALSWALLRARYRASHIAGAAACVAGLAVLLLGDGRELSGGGLRSSDGTDSSGASLLRRLLDSGGGGAGGSSSGGQHHHHARPPGSGAGASPLLGDALVLLGALLYGLCNVLQEMLLSDVPPGQLLAALGAWGAAISGLQAALLERRAIASAAWTSPSVAGPLAGFAAAMFVFYSAVPAVLLLAGATVLQLGLLTSDAWAAGARYLWFGGFSRGAAFTFAGSLALIAGGIGVFALAGSPRVADAGGDAGGSKGPPAGGAGGGRYRRVPLAAPDDVEEAAQQQPPQQAAGSAVSA